MKRQILLTVIFIGITALVAYQLKSGSSMAAEHLPPADAALFWAYITETDSYQNWDHWPGYDGIYPGRSPHGAYLKLYANSIAIKAAKAGEPMPHGAIIVKENYGKDQATLMAVTPMYRMEGYNPDAGDWFWAKYGPTGEVLTAGKPKGCIDCHGSVAGNDWLFTEVK